MGRIAYDKPEILMCHILHHELMADEYLAISLEEIHHGNIKESNRLFSRAKYHGKKSMQLSEKFINLYGKILLNELSKNINIKTFGFQS